MFSSWLAFCIRRLVLSSPRMKASESNSAPQTKMTSPRSELINFTSQPLRTIGVLCDDLRRRKNLVTTVVLLFSAVVSGCTQIGPMAIRNGRTRYNEAFASSTDQELLLNIVRLRYRDTPFFLNVDKVAASIEAYADVSGFYPIGDASSISLKNITAPGFGAHGSESPTVFYSPMEGERYARQMMSRLNFDVLLLLVNSGWSIERLMAVTLQEMNGLKNAPTASGPTPSKEPEFRDFREALRCLRSLQVKGLVELAKGDAEDDSAVYLRIVNGEKDADALQFKKMLGLAMDQNTFQLKAGMGRGDGQTIYVITRPVISTLNYLSQSVIAPESDIASGRVTRTLKTSGKPFDWQELFSGIFKVQSSSGLKPRHSAVSVEYRGTWFYIGDDDLDSKSTFSLLTQILALQSGKAAGKETPLTFSIGK